MIRLLALAVLAQLGCRGSKPTTHPAKAPRSIRADARMVRVPAGVVRLGSTKEERGQAYKDYRSTSGRDTARKKRWFRYESEASERALPGFRIDLHPVTQAAYAEFVHSTRAGAPAITAEAWKAQGYVQDFATEVARFNWKSSKPPAGRDRHPVVLVPWHRAVEYCKWRGRLVGEERRLPSAEEFESAARGVRNAIYPWGPAFDSARLNSAVAGPRDTVPVESFPEGASAAGVLGMAGNVFQWTSTPWPRGKRRMTVKGSAWDDWGGLGRAAAGHGRPATVLHAIVGFRCAGPLDPGPP